MGPQVEQGGRVSRGGDRMWEKLGGTVSCKAGVGSGAAGSEVGVGGRSAGRVGRGYVE